MITTWAGKYKIFLKLRVDTIASHYEYETIGLRTDTRNKQKYHRVMHLRHTGTQCLYFYVLRRLATVMTSCELRHTVQPAVITLQQSEDMWKGRIYTNEVPKKKFQMQNVTAILIRQCD